MNYQICRRCIMDTSAPDIRFDADGNCNFCGDYLASIGGAGEFFFRRRAQRDEFLERVRKSGAGRPYDCVIGLSGGVDSSYALYLAKQHGLRPLAVHLDNGWDSELAVKNIENLVRKLDVDLHTHVIDWQENRDLQLSFFKADVIDIELLMDNAMLALNYQQAREHRVRHILSGTNQATEGLRMPRGWNHYKLDVRNIRAVHRRFGTVPIRTHPLISTLDYFVYRYLYRIEWVSFLDYFAYDKQQAIDVLVREIGYRPYPYKHYESMFTRFYQGYILPRKCGVDKRRVHLSTLILSGQMSRDEALARMAESPYPDSDQMRDDRVYLLKKLGLTEEWFDAYLGRPVVPHDEFASEESLMYRLGRIKKCLSGLDPRTQ